MDYKDHARLGLFILKRLLQAFVTWPASAVGCLALLAGLLGGSPFHDTVAGVASWAESSFRNAPAGMMLVSECARQNVKRSIECKATSARAYPVAEVTAYVESNIHGVYQALVLLSFTAMVITMGWREFLGLPSPKAAGPAQGQARNNP